MPKCQYDALRRALKLYRRQKKKRNLEVLEPVFNRGGGGGGVITLGYHISLISVVLKKQNADFLRVRCTHCTALSCTHAAILHDRSST